MTPLQPIPPPLSAPKRRTEALLLPPYRYVPGLHPHPFRHPNGHMYTDGGPPKHTQRWDPEIPWTQDTAYLYAADLFDHRFYWEAHEAWEALWHQSVQLPPLHDVLQSLIQLSAAILKMHMQQPQAAHSLLDKASNRLVAVEATQGPFCRGLHLPSVRQRISHHLEGGPWPLLPLEHSC